MSVSRVKIAGGVGIQRLIAAGCVKVAGGVLVHST